MFAAEIWEFGAGKLPYVDALIRERELAADEGKAAEVLEALKGAKKKGDTSCGTRKNQRGYTKDACEGSRAIR